jgi:hypothetical protein
MSIARINLFWLIIFSLTLPIGVVVSTHLARSSFEKVKLRGQTITVKGYAEQRITSDLAMWSATIGRREPRLDQAYNTLAAHRGALLEYLAGHGFTQDRVTFSAVRIREIHKLNDEGKKTNEIEAYEVYQDFAIDSKDVHRIAGVARDAGELIARDIALDADAPRYLYTPLDSKKLEMLAAATTNGRARAERLVAASDNALGPLRSASQGVFQITPAYSTEISSYGENDTTAIEKAIKAVVTVEYAIQ